jgi:hypothetical protein
MAVKPTVREFGINVTSLGLTRGCPRGRYVRVTTMSGSVPNAVAGRWRQIRLHSHRMSTDIIQPDG